MENKTSVTTTIEDWAGMIVESKSMLQTLLYLEAKRISKEENKDYNTVIIEIQTMVSAFIKENSDKLKKDQD